MDRTFGPRGKCCAVHLTTVIIVLVISLTGGPTFLSAQERGQGVLTTDVGKAELPRGNHTANSETGPQAQRKEIPLRIPAGAAELLRLKSEPSLEGKAEPVVPPAR